MGLYSHLQPFFLGQQPDPHLIPAVDHGEQRQVAIGPPLAPRHGAQCKLVQHIVREQELPRPARACPKHPFPGLRVEVNVACISPIRRALILVSLMRKAN